MTRQPEPRQRKLCATCGKPLVARDQKDRRTAVYCPTCDGPDPLHSPRAIGWVKSSLHPPKRAQ